ncbi:radical SAM protein [Nocardia otitidiscaviarum]|uniref:radical SAM protein n=1 Tax=Nocardia otitidiscaviarum TaxID=1823 RepID=UPI0018948E57|nr:radical SAM protein [Nocardia otitidiscaviarum]MBF6183381.1 radical SAM protein [Nocardia otitidiscaviarum]
MRYNTLAVHITNRCPLTCAHCITDSSPRARGDLSWKQVEAAVRSAAQFVDGVCITGGEPMLLPDLAMASIRFTRSLGLRSSMVTSGYWARDKDKTTEIITRLAAAGLDKLAVSFDQYHLVQPTAPYIGEDTLHRLLSAATNTDMELVVQYCGPQHHDAYALAEKAADRFGARFEAAEVLPFGRGIQLARARRATIDEVPETACGVVGRPVLTPEGDLYTCCGPARGAPADSPLRLPISRVDDVGDALAGAARDPIINAIYVRGPRRMFDMLSTPAQERVSTKLRNGSMCALCRAITDDPDAVIELRAALGPLALQLVAQAGVVHVRGDERLMPTTPLAESKEAQCRR